jgi:hypothetical protein
VAGGLRRTLINIGTDVSQLLGRQRSNLGGRISMGGHSLNRSSRFFVDIVDLCSGEAVLFYQFLAFLLASPEDNVRNPRLSSAASRLWCHYSLVTAVDFILFVLSVKRPPSAFESAARMIYRMISGDGITHTTLTATGHRRRTTRRSWCSTLFDKLTPKQYARPVARRGVDPSRAALPSLYWAMRMALRRRALLRRHLFCLLAFLHLSSIFDEYQREDISGS